MDIERLKTFIDATQTRSFSKTAKRLHVAQPTVSKHIRDLEQELEVCLFERSGAGINLTQAGLTLLPWARRLVLEARQLEDLAKSLEGDVVGKLNIACTTAAGKYILPRLAARFRHLHPNVQISILGCTQEGAIEQLLQEEAELGVVSYEMGLKELQCQYFFTDHIILIVPAAHEWARKRSIEPADLIGEPMIMREPTSGTRRALLTELAAHDITENDLDIFLELGNAEAIVAAVEAGIGLSFVSRMSAACPLASECVVEVPVQGFDLRRRICMVRRAMPVPNRALDVFWRFIHDPENDDILKMAMK